MALSLLLDEQMSPVVAAQVQARKPEIRIASVQTWRSGELRSQTDADLLRAARDEKMTLVTYDLHTILPLVTGWGESGEAHSGVVFIDNRTIPQGDIGGQVAALEQHWDATCTWDWENVVMFLQPAKR
ncbi:MAG TPA: DUF5615 family PIN-like protein [Chthonomonadaceae bacterium]|nr:DUF5615 family PIN-like protein [Chthonomonadaceae bacterium]